MVDVVGVEAVGVFWMPVINIGKKKNGARNPIRPYDYLQVDTVRCMQCSAAQYSVEE